MRHQPPAKQLAAYIRARQEYEQGTGTLDDMTAKVTPGVADLLDRAETARLHREREDAEVLRADRLHARRERFTLAYAAVMAAAALIAFVFALTVQAKPHHAAQAQPPQPALVTKYTGPGTLVTTTPIGGGTRHAFHVRTVIERTNGMMTKLPIEYVDDAGYPHFYADMFQFLPDPEEAP